MLDNKDISDGVAVQQLSQTQRLVLEIERCLGFYPNRMNRRWTRHYFPRAVFPMTMEELRSLYMASYLFRKGGYLRSRSRCVGFSRDSLGKLMMDYRENRAVRYVVKEMLNRFQEANHGDGGRYRCLTGSEAVDLRDLFWTFMIPSGSIGGLKKEEVHEVMRETDLFYFHGRRSGVYVNMNYFAHWVHPNVFKFMNQNLTYNLHLWSINQELSCINDPRKPYYHPVTDRVALYIQGKSRWYNAYKDLRIGKIKLYNSNINKNSNLY